MTLKRQHPERFDPTAAIGWDDPLPTVPRADATGRPEDDRLVRLIAEATQPPAGLKLDWDRFRSRLRDEPLPRRAASRRWRIALYLSSGAIAAGLMLTTLLLMRSGQPTNQIAVNLPPPSSAVAAVEVHVGMDSAQARQLIDRPAGKPGEQPAIVVVYPRMAPAASPAPSEKDKLNQPIILTDKAPVMGTPYGRGSGDADSDFIGF